MIKVDIPKTDKYATLLNSYAAYKLDVETGTIRHNLQEDTERFTELCASGASLGLGLHEVNSDIVTTQERLKTKKALELHD